VVLKKPGKEKILRIMPLLTFVLHYLLKVDFPGDPVKKQLY
jgi:hypothetical protein